MVPEVQTALLKWKEDTESQGRFKTQKTHHTNNTTDAGQNCPAQHTLPLC